MDETATERPDRVLLTGSRGGIGRHLADRLLERGYQVRGLDLLPLPGGSARPDDHVGDLRDLEVVRQAMAGIDAVIHAGAIPFDTGDGSQVMATNVLGTWNVLQAAHEAGVPRVVSFSSVNAQGSVGGWRPTEYLPLDDGYPAHPATPYQLSKHLGEEACRSFSERYGMVTLCLRPVWVTDVANYTDPSWASDAFMADWRDELWAYVDVRDVADAVLRCLTLQGVLHDRFLLAARDTSATVPTGRLIDDAFAAVAWPAISRAAWLADDPFRSLVDTRHATEVLGWRPRHSWRDVGSGHPPRKEPA